jgi:hypothetical protein
MPDRFAVLKLLWNNLQYMKEKGESPDSTYDFLGANDLVTFLFNEDERYVKLLMLTLEMGRWSEVETLDPRFMGLYDGFFSEWSGTIGQTGCAQKTVKAPTKSKEKKQTKVKKVEAPVETVEEVDETVEEKVEETVEDEKSDIELASDSDSDSEILSESDDENELETFYDEYVLEVDNNEKKVELSLLLEKYNSYCETNNMEKDEEGLETFLVEKLGKPKGKKKPKFVGVELKA